MRSFSVFYKSVEDIENALKVNPVGEGGQVLIQVFSGIINPEYISKVTEEVRELIPDSKIIGMTTAGEIFQGKSHEYACVIVISVFDHTEIDILSYTWSELLEEESRGYNLMEDASKGQVMIAFFSVDTTQILDGVSFFDEESDVVVAGGMAGSLEGSMTPMTYVFDGYRVMDQGLVIAALKGENLQVHADSNFSFVPLGKEFEVTGVDGIAVTEIDGVSPRKFYESHIGPGTADNVDICTQFPIVYMQNEVLTSSPAYFLPGDDRLRIISKLEKGQKIRLGYGNKMDLINGSDRVMRELVNRPVESLFVYSCIGRKNLLKDLVDYDIASINKVMPVNGCYTFGEFNHIRGKNHLLMQTMTLLGLSENHASKIEIPDNTELSSGLFKDPEESVLHHLIKVTGDELNTLTKQLEDEVIMQSKALVTLYQQDSVTGLWNRRKLTEDLKEYTDVVTAFVRITNFRDISNFYGVEQGDALLKAIGQYLEEQAKDFDVTSYRIGSATFALLTQADTELVEKYGEQFDHLLAELNGMTFDVKGYHMDVLAAGAIVVGSDMTIEKGSLTLEKCIAEGHDYLRYDPSYELLEQVKKNLTMVDKVRKAMAEDRIVPYFQPIVDNNTGKIVKYESLVRLIEEDGSVLSPFFFLGAAEKGGLYEELTRIMIRKTFETFRNNLYEFSINVLLKDIRDQRTRAMIDAYLSDPVFDGRCVFEIVESEGIEDFDEVKSFIKGVKAKGAKVAIDDFGTGYSNFMYLVELDVDFIKIDGSIIKHIDEDDTSLKVAGTIVDFSNRLGLKTIGEFVHSDQVYDKVVELSVDFSQGYYFGAPEPDIRGQ